MVTVNHGGRLRPEYFKSYLMLIMSSHECSLDCAKDFTIKNFFHGDSDFFGPESRSSFEEALSSLRKG